MNYGEIGLHGGFEVSGNHSVVCIVLRVQVKFENSERAGFNMKFCHQMWKYRELYHVSFERLSFLYQHHVLCELDKAISYGNLNEQLLKSSEAYSYPSIIGEEGGPHMSVYGGRGVKERQSF